MWRAVRTKRSRSSASLALQKISTKMRQYLQPTASLISSARVKTTKSAAIVVTLLEMLHSIISHVAPKQRRVVVPVD